MIVFGLAADFATLKGSIESVREFRRALKVNLVEQDSEFFTTEPANKSLITHQVQEQCPGFAKHVVTLGVAMVVVNLLEEVDVQHDHADEVAIGCLPDLLKQLPERTPVVAFGQRIAGGKELQLGILFLNFISRLLKRGHKFREVSLLLFQLGHIVEANQHAAAVILWPSDWIRIDFVFEGFQFVFGFDQATDNRFVGFNTANPRRSRILAFYLEIPRKVGE